jgi:hypothetical protein
MLRTGEALIRVRVAGVNFAVRNLFNATQTA